MSADKILHNFNTPLRASYLVSKRGLSVSDFIKDGVIINSSDGTLTSLDFENKNSYYLSNDGEGVIWKKPTWLEIDAPSPTNRLDLAIITLPSAYRRITISQASPQNTVGDEGDIWLTFL